MPHKEIYRDFLAHTEDLLTSYDERQNAVSLRRCVSAAYYSVWHCLCYAWSIKFDSSLQGKLYRKPDHIKAKKAASDMQGRKNTWKEKNSECCEDLQCFCEDFIRLQEARHLADYDIDVIIPKHEAIAAVARAKRCISLFESVISGQQKDAAVIMEVDCFLLESLSLKHQDRN